jgi:hypothetical protein
MRQFRRQLFSGRGRAGAPAPWDRRAVEVENGRIPAGFSRHPAIFRRKVLPVLPFTAGVRAQ